MERYCIFCEIIAKRSPADVIFENERVIVFRNVLRWVPVMLLAVPKEHQTQSELWASDLIGELGGIASEVGREHCPGGFRLASNFGWDAKQSQEHAHIHILAARSSGTT